MLDDGILKLPEIHYCEYCHRPDVGADRCPHAINRKFDCQKTRRLPGRSLTGSGGSGDE